MSIYRRRDCQRGVDGSDSGWWLSPPREQRLASSFDKNKEMSIYRLKPPKSTQTNLYILPYTNTHQQHHSSTMKNCQLPIHQQIHLKNAVLTPQLQILLFLSCIYLNFFLLLSTY